MTEANGVESRVRVLEYRADESSRDIQGIWTEIRGLRKDMNDGIASFNAKMARQNLATWMLVAALLSAAAAILAAIR